jgi:hypothetical protein
MLVKSQYQLIGTISAISKASAAVITLAPAYRPVDGRCVAGVFVHVKAPGWTALPEGPTLLVNSVNAAAGTITVAADTTAQVDTTIDPYAQVNMHN